MGVPSAWPGSGRGVCPDRRSWQAWRGLAHSLLTGSVAVKGMVFRLLPPGLLLPRAWICFAPKVEPTALKITERIGFCLHLLCSRETERMEHHALTFYLLLFVGHYNTDSFRPERSFGVVNYFLLLSLLVVTTWCCLRGPDDLAVSFCAPHQYLSVCACVCVRAHLWRCLDTF